MKNTILLISSLFMLNFCGAQNLLEHRWEQRVILVFAPTPEHPRATRQTNLLTEAAAEVTERDLVLYQLYPKKGISPDGLTIRTEEVGEWFQQFRIEKNEFTFILIGKDGGEKLRSNEVVKLEDLWALIDGMPMRQAEMRRQKNGH